MKKVIIAAVVLLLAAAVVAYFFRDRLSPPPPTLRPSGPITDHLSPEEKTHLQAVEMDVKRQRIYSGDMNVPPPCPPDTREDDGFCRKDREMFVGAGGGQMDGSSCRPDGCDMLCKKICEEAAGEECTLAEDIQAKCLADHPPSKAAESPEERRQQGIECEEDHYEEYRQYRCTYTTSIHEEFRYVRSATDAECRQMYDSYERCVAALPERKKTQDRSKPTEEEMECVRILNREFAPARCQAVTGSDGKLYGKAMGDEFFCGYVCR